MAAHRKPRGFGPQLALCWSSGKFSLAVAVVETCFRGHLPLLRALPRMFQLAISEAALIKKAFQVCGAVRPENPLNAYPVALAKTVVLAKDLSTSALTVLLAVTFSYNF